MESYKTYSLCLETFTQHGICNSYILLHISVVHCFILLCGITLCEFTILYVFILLLINIEIVSSVYLGVELLRDRVSIC